MLKHGSPRWSPAGKPDGAATPSVGGERQSQLEVCAPGSRTERDGATMLLGNLAHDRQAKTSAAVVACSRLVEPNESVEDAVGIAFGYAWSVVDDVEHGVSSVSAHCSRDRPQLIRPSK